MANKRQRISLYDRAVSTAPRGVLFTQEDETVHVTGWFTGYWAGRRDALRILRSRRKPKARTK
jgi:hypothetical protein